MIPQHSNWLAERARVSPVHPAIVIEDRQLSYAELFEISRAYASWLAENLDPTSKVALFLNNSVEMIALIHAATMSGMELVLINARLTSEEINWQLEFVETDILISSSQFSSILRGINSVRICVTDQSDEFEQMKPVAEDHDIVVAASDDILCYVFTSGTTGRPKAVPLTYGNIYASAKSSARRLKVFDDDRWLLTMPMYHLGGLSIVFRCCIYGITTVLRSRFDPEQIVRDISRVKITQISLVPLMLRRLLPILNSPSNIRLILLGGATAPMDLIKASLEQNLPIATTYGMTETSSQFATALPEKVRKKPRSVGRPLDGAELKIHNPNHEGIGEILVKGPMVMSGYVKMEDQPILDGYLRTGDIGYVDTDGDLFVIQRRSDLIISGGENIYPSEIEQLLIQHPTIAEVCVLGVGDEVWGQIPIAILETTGPVTSDQLHAFLEDKLATYKFPNAFYQISNFPRTSSGKIKRKQVLEMHQSDELQEIE